MAMLIRNSILKKGAYYSLYFAVLLSFVTDKGVSGGILGRGGALALGLLPLFLGTLLVVHGRIVEAVKRIQADSLSVCIVLLGIVILILQIISNSFSGWTWEAIKGQLYWLSGIMSAISLITASKLDMLDGLKGGTLVAAFFVGQFVNLFAALPQIPKLVSCVGTGYYLHGMVASWLLFGFLCVISALILWHAAFSSIWANGWLTRSILMALSLISVAFIPTSGSRTATICFFLMLGMWPLISRERRQFFFFPLFFILGLLFTAHLNGSGAITTPHLQDARAITLYNPSTVARSYLYKNDMWIISNHWATGIGMDLTRYSQLACKGPSFSKFATVDPWVAEKPLPHSWWLGIVIQSGIASGVLYLLFVLAVLSYMLRTSRTLTTCSPEFKSFMSAYVLVNIWLLVQYSFLIQWVLLAAALGLSAVASSPVSDSKIRSTTLRELPSNSI